MSESSVHYVASSMKDHSLHFKDIITIATYSDVVKFLTTYCNYDLSGDLIVRC